MEPNKKLDLALSFYYKSFHDKSRKTDYEHISDIVTNNPELQGNTSVDEARLIANKLCKDEYIDVKEFGSDFHAINYNGMMFYLQGSYTQQLKNVKLKRFRLRLLNKTVALGTGLAGLYALWMICKGFLSLCAYFCHYCF